MVSTAKSTLTKFTSTYFPTYTKSTTGGLWTDPAVDPPLIRRWCGSLMWPRIHEVSTTLINRMANATCVCRLPIGLFKSALDSKKVKGSQPHPCLGPGLAGGWAQVGNHGKCCEKVGNLLDLLVHKVEFRQWCTDGSFCIFYFCRRQRYSSPDRRFREALACSLPNSRCCGRWRCECDPLYPSCLGSWYSSAKRWAPGWGSSWEGSNEPSWGTYRPNVETRRWQWVLTEILSDMPYMATRTLFTLFNMW